MLHETVQPLVLETPIMKQERRWFHEKESGHGGPSEAEVQVWGSAVDHTAWPEQHVSARSAFQTPVASPPGHNGCTPPRRSHRGQDRVQRWTCLSFR